MFSRYSPWSSWSRKVWQILWYVVFGCHHVYSVSESTPYPVFQTLPLIFSQIIIWRPVSYLVRNDFIHFNVFASLNSSDFVATLLSIPITAWPYHLAWKRGSEWDSTSFQILNGPKSLTMVGFHILFLNVCCYVMMLFMFRFVQINCLFINFNLSQTPHQEVAKDRPLDEVDHIRVYEPSLDYCKNIFMENITNLCCVMVGLI